MVGECHRAGPSRLVAWREGWSQGQSPLGILLCSDSDLWESSGQRRWKVVPILRKTPEGAEVALGWGALCYLQELK